MIIIISRGIKWEEWTPIELLGGVLLERRQVFSSAGEQNRRVQQTFSHLCLFLSGYIPTLSASPPHQKPLPSLPCCRSSLTQPSLPLSVKPHLACAIIAPSATLAGKTDHFSCVCFTLSRWQPRRFTASHREEQRPARCCQRRAPTEPDRAGPVWNTTFNVLYSSVPSYRCWSGSGGVAGGRRMFYRLELTHVRYLK